MACVGQASLLRLPSPGVRITRRHAARIAYGDADAMVAGALEKPVRRWAWWFWRSARAVDLNDNPQAASRPWDKETRWFVLGDGAGMLVCLKSMNMQKRVVRKIYAEIAGFLQASSDAYHMTSPPENGAGAALAMVNALRDAAIEPAQIATSTHGTSMPAGDKARRRRLSQSWRCCKPSDGELDQIDDRPSVGAAGAVESGFSLFGATRSAIPPTINLDKPRMKRLSDFVPHEARRQRSGVCLCNSYLAELTVRF